MRSLTARSRFTMFLIRQMKKLDGIMPMQSRERSEQVRYFRPYMNVIGEPSFKVIV